MIKQFRVTKINVMILYFASIFSCVLSKIFNITGMIDNLKYALFALCILFGIIYLKQNNKKLILKKEIKVMMMMVVLLLGVSINNATANLTLISPRTIIELLYIVIPVVCAFLLINIFSKEDIINYMVILLIGLLLFYIIEIFTMNIDFGQIQSISILNSYSPFESYIFADVSLFFFCFFSYFRNEKIEHKKYYLNMNQCYYISFIFVLLTFKRILMLFAIILFIMNFFNFHKYKVNKKIIYLIMISFFVITILYAWLLSGENSKILNDLFSIDLDKFTVGRKWYYSIVENNSSLHNTYGSTTNILCNVLGPGKYLEMDLIKILIETGPVSLGFFIYAYWKQIGYNLFSVVVFLFLFINLLFSHSLTTYYAWSLFFLMFYLIKISDYKKNKEEVE